MKQDKKILQIHFQKKTLEKQNALLGIIFQKYLMKGIKKKLLAKILVHMNL